MHHSARVLSLAVVGLGLVACTSGSHAGPHPGTTGPKPIVVGLINTEDAPVGSFPDLRRGAIAAEHYVNDTFGGVRGQRLDVVSCTTTGTPESSQACANKLLAKHPVAVIGGVDLGAAASLPPLQAAHVPYVGGTPAATEALTSGGSYMLTGGTATEVLAEVAYATQTLHVTRMAVVYSDVPGLLSQAASLLTTIVHKKGVSDFKLFPVEGGSPDLVPVLSAAASRHPQAVLAVFSAQDCARLVQSVGAVGLKTTMMYPSFCASQSVLHTGGRSVDGSVFASGYRPYTDATDPDVQTYVTALGKYDKSLKPSLLSEAGFADVIVLRQLLTEVTGALSPQALGATLRAARDHRGFLSHAFTCDGHQVPLLGGLCNAYAQVSVVKNGTLQPVGDWVDTAPVAKLVG